MTRGQPVVECLKWTIERKCKWKSCDCVGIYSEVWRGHGQITLQSICQGVFRN